MITITNLTTADIAIAYQGTNKWGDAMYDWNAIAAIDSIVWFEDTKRGVRHAAVAVADADLYFTLTDQMMTLKYESLRLLKSRVMEMNALFTY